MKLKTFDEFLSSLTDEDWDYIYMAIMMMKKTTVLLKLLLETRKPLINSVPLSQVVVSGCADVSWRSIMNGFPNSFANTATTDLHIRIELHASPNSLEFFSYCHQLLIYLF